MDSKGFVVDRTENGMIILCGIEDNICVEVSAMKFGETFCDGDIVEVSFDNNGEIAKITIDKNETLVRRKSIKKKLKSLFDN